MNVVVLCVESRHAGLRSTRMEFRRSGFTTWAV